METETKATLAAALATGYVLGRTKKGKLAIGVASVLAGQGLLSPKELVSRALRMASESPQAAQLLGQVRGELMDSARAALSATADRRLGALADSLQQRMSSPGEKPDDDEEEPLDEREPDDADEAAEEEEEPEETPPPRSRAKKKTPAKRSAAKTPPRKKAPAGKKAAASKPTGKKAAASKATGKKAAAGKTPTRGSRRR
ncbi:hypothetical protein [Streptomyces sp. NBC_01614]|uniref:hypothetical protein n=1 Tax=Streptomyces sp. NBC_01614 TaxID=2975897 RepID=UPI003869A1E2